jgi:uncharacterized protein
MRFAEDNNSTYSIQSVSEDGIVINDKLIRRSVLVSANTVQDWPPRCIGDMTADHLALCQALSPEIVLIGTGNSQVFPPAKDIIRLQEQGIGVEIMANPAACRTFNVLLSEDRRVVLALILEPPAGS